MSEDILARIESEREEKCREIDAKRRELAAIETEADDMERAIAVLRVIPDHSLASLESAARVLRRLAGDANHNATVEKAAPSTNGVHTVLTHQPRKQDLAGMTIEQAAIQILTENHGNPVNSRWLAEQAIGRGYTSGRKDTDRKKVVRSFSQTLGRIAQKQGAFERTPAGDFKLR